MIAAFLRPGEELIPKYYQMRYFSHYTQSRLVGMACGDPHPTEFRATIPFLGDVGFIAHPISVTKAIQTIKGRLRKRNETYAGG